MGYHKRPLYLNLKEAVGKENCSWDSAVLVSESVPLLSLYLSHTCRHTALLCMSCSAPTSAALHIKSTIKPLMLLLVKSYQRHWPAAGETGEVCCCDAHTSVHVNAADRRINVKIAVPWPGL